jgi:hypothetical protein
MEKAMSGEFPKYYRHKDGFGGNILYVVRRSPEESRLIAINGTEKELHWDFMMDKYVADGDWIQIPTHVVESKNVYAFDPASGPDQSVTALWCGTKVIASIDGNGVFRFTVDASQANAAEFITMIEEFLKRRVTAIDVTQSEPALPV